MRVIFDTNIWMSFTLGNLMSDLPEMLLRPNLELFACEELFAEFERVRRYPKLTKILRPSRIEATLELMTAKAIVVEIEARKADFSDSKDNFLLDLAETVEADFLVTGDKRLANLGSHGKTRLVSYADFRQMLNAA